MIKNNGVNTMFNSTLDIVSHYESLINRSSLDDSKNSNYIRSQEDISSTPGRFSRNLKLVEAKLRQARAEIVSLSQRNVELERQNEELIKTVKALRRSCSTQYTTEPENFGNTESLGATCLDEKDTMFYNETDRSSVINKFACYSSSNTSLGISGSSRKRSLSTTSCDIESKIKKNNGFSTPQKFNGNDSSLFNYSRDPVQFVTPIREMIAHMTTKWAKYEDIENNPHKVVKPKVFVGYCDICETFVLKGKNCLTCTECNIFLHSNCMKDAPIPCVPRPPITSKQPKIRPSLLDFCPRLHPMIPYIVVHGVIAIEKYFITTEGLYRIPGAGCEVVKLLNNFKHNRVIPDLKSCAAETITGCIKKFLRELREPLIPTTSCLEFIKAVKLRDLEGLNFAICNLPSPNRDTLAYLCLHWKKVASLAHINKMPIENIACCLGPTVVGSVIKSHESVLNKVEEEARDQNNVVVQLLNLTEDYWKQVLKGKLNGI
ncbi:Rac GTPase-activating protein 1 [Strongyloides ratti]|uniref:Rac GTPase-activating protein 1 n=1 Tax=Strongyloides ratti TaxID=34506 RepID=A0A090MY79_STRRB|nr:Rac GTPase-activating protein 1 [Strongyloides ratti]CEF66714.1 Rac GTPase-activating protein 1 [Strongyloides ratti]